MSKVLVFVYGTLKSGLEFNYLLNTEGGLFVGPAELFDSNFVLVDGKLFPYAVPVSEHQVEHLQDEGVDNCIEGEVWEVSHEIFKSLDRLEGYPGHYNRCELSVTLNRDGEEVKAFMYHRNEPLCNGEPVCTGGVWWPSINTIKANSSQVDHSKIC